MAPAPTVSPKMPEAIQVGTPLEAPDCFVESGDVSDMGKSFAKCISSRAKNAVAIIPRRMACQSVDLWKGSQARSNHLADRRIDPNLTEHASARRIEPAGREIPQDYATARGAKVTGHCLISGSTFRWKQQKRSQREPGLLACWRPLNDKLFSNFQTVDKSLYGQHLGNICSIM
jgi:hypothetical protein